MKKHSVWFLKAAGFSVKQKTSWSGNQKHFFKFYNCFEIGLKPKTDQYNKLKRVIRSKNLLGSNSQAKSLTKQYTEYQKVEKTWSKGE